MYLCYNIPMNVLSRNVDIPGTPDRHRLEGRLVGAYNLLSTELMAPDEILRVIKGVPLADNHIHPLRARFGSDYGYLDVIARFQPNIDGISTVDGLGINLHHFSRPTSTTIMLLEAPDGTDIADRKFSITPSGHTAPTFTANFEHVASFLDDITQNKTQNIAMLLDPRDTSISFDYAITQLLESLGHGAKKSEMSKKYLTNEILVSDINSVEFVQETKFSLGALYRKGRLDILTVEVKGNFELTDGTATKVAVFIHQPATGKSGVQYKLKSNEINVDDLADLEGSNPNALDEIRLFDRALDRLVEDKVTLSLR